MTDRINALIVTLDHDIREDDVEHIVGAIHMIKYVASVKKNVADIGSHIAYERAVLAVGKALFDALDNVKPTG